MPPIRIISYNLDGCRDIAAVSCTINAANADIVALQNISSLPTDQNISTLAIQTGYPFFSRGQAGTLAIMAKMSLKFVQTYTLGDGACCMKLDLHYQEKRFILLNICLRGGFLNRPSQIRQLLGPNLIDSSVLTLPTLLLGDFYDIVWVSGHYRFNDQLKRWAPPLFRATYPSRLPLVSRDRVYAMGGMRLEHIYIDRSKCARAATGHLPTIFDLTITDTRIPLIERKQVRGAKLNIVPG